MKKKKLVVFFLALIPLYLIYNITYKEKFTYLAIGDDLAKGHTPFDTYGESYTDYIYTYIKNQKKEAKINKEFIEEDLRIKDLLNKIKNADLKDGKTLTQAIKESELITIYIVSEEIFIKLISNYELYNLNTKKMYEYIDKLTQELEELIKEMNKIKKTNIYLIGYYNPLPENNENSIKIDSIFNYIDTSLKKIEEKYKIHYINIYNEFKKNKNYLPNPGHAFPSLEGYNYIANEIIKELKLN